jgi:hypothetical protein
MSMFEFCLGCGRRRDERQTGQCHTYSMNTFVVWCVSVVSTSLPFFVLQSSPLIAYHLAYGYSFLYISALQVLRISVYLIMGEVSAMDVACGSPLYYHLRHSCVMAFGGWSWLQDTLEISACASPIGVVFPLEG